jgi:hypothetical protein
MASLPTSSGGISAIVTVAQNIVVALGKIASILSTSFPQTTGTATSATAGTNGAVPAQVVGYLTIVLPNGSIGKIPYFGP